MQSFEFVSRWMRFKLRKWNENFLNFLKISSKKFGNLKIFLHIAFWIFTNLENVLANASESIFKSYKAEINSPVWKYFCAYYRLPSCRERERERERVYTDNKFRYRCSRKKRAVDGCNRLARPPPVCSNNLTHWTMHRVRLFPIRFKKQIFKQIKNNYV